MRDDGAHYPFEGLTEIQPDASFTSYPLIDSELGNRYAEEAASNYLFFSGTASRQNLRVQLHGTAGWMAHRQISWIGTTGWNTHQEFSVDRRARSSSCPSGSSTIRSRS